MAGVEWHVACEKFDEAVALTCPAALLTHVAAVNSKTSLLAAFQPTLLPRQVFRAECADGFVYKLSV